MNIFILSYHTDWQKHMTCQAHSHCDRHVIKMITESVQMLSTALLTNDEIATIANQNPATAISYQKHPCTQWASESLHSFTYLTDLAIALCDEKQHRWPLNRTHAYEPWLNKLREALPTYADVPELFPIAIPDSEDATKLTGVPVNLDRACDLYQRYYATRKADFATWKNRPIPIWYIMEMEILNRKKGSAL